MQGATSVSGLKSRGFLYFLGTQFLGAFNDNAFKFLIIGYATRVLTADAAKNYIPLASGVFILPFLLFSSYAGYLSDRYAKHTVMVWTKILEIVIMVAGLCLFWFDAIYWLLLVLFLMGAQSTLFSPAKYGYLPETLAPEKLSAGNGVLQLFTFLAIIAGGGIGGWLAESYHDCIYKGALVCVAVAVAGTLTSLGIGRAKPGVASARPSFDPLTPHVRTFKEMFRNPAMELAVLGATFFWLLATVYQSNIAIIVRQDMGEGETAMGYLQAALALGIGIGSATAGALSKGRIAYHFIIPSGFCVGVIMILCGCASTSLTGSLLVGGALGFAGGFYLIPLTTHIQQKSPENSRGACLAACNTLDSISMLLGTGFHWVLLTPLALSGGNVLIALGVLILVFMWFLARLRTHFGIWKPLHRLRKSAGNSSETA